MSILDDILAYDEEKEEDERIADEVKATVDQSPSFVPQSGERWFHSYASPEVKESSSAPPLRETKLKKVHTSKLVWAKCHYFKGGHAEFPGRIAELSEAACQRDIPVAILPECELIEFFCIPKKDPSVPQYVIVEKSDIWPYNAAMGGRKQLTLMNSFAKHSSGNGQIYKQAWDADYNENLREKLKEKYKISIGNTLYIKIKEKANEFLKNAIDYNQPDTAVVIKDDTYDDSDVEAEVIAEVDLFSLVSSKGGAQQTITAGRWISFQHKIFKDKTVYVRVVEVTGNSREPILLENDDVLRPRDVVCLLDEIPSDITASDDADVGTRKGGLKNVFVEGKGGYVKGSGSSRALKEFKFEISKIDFVSLQQALRREVRRGSTLMEDHVDVPMGPEREDKGGDCKAHMGGSVSMSMSTASHSSSRSAESTREIMKVTNNDEEDAMIFSDVRQHQQREERKRKEDACRVTDLTGSPEPNFKRRVSVSAVGPSPSRQGKLRSDKKN